MIITQRSRRVEIFQHAEQTSSVPVIRHAATVIDVSCCVYEHLESWGKMDEEALAQQGALKTLETKKPTFKRHVLERSKNRMVKRWQMESFKKTKK